MTVPRPKRKKRNESYLKGQLLVAMPLMTDRRFARSVIYMCAHSDDGAMGLIINHRADHISFPDLLERLGIAPRNADDGISNEILERQVHVGRARRDRPRLRAALVRLLRERIDAADRPRSEPHGIDRYPEGHRLR